MAVFNSGADFVYFDKGRLTAGSYRNLYEDKAVGRLRSADPLTQRSVTKLLEELGWIKSDESCETHLSYEAVTCDGLPLVGTLSDLPGIYVVGGFAARSGNYLFEVAESLISSILSGSSSNLELFSTRRFI